MKASRLLIFLLASIAMAAILPALSAAESYSSQFSGVVHDGDVKTVNGCSLIFTVPDVVGASLLVQVQSVYGTGNISVSPGNPYYYYDRLLIYVVTMNATSRQAYVDIQVPVVTPTPGPTGTKIYCDTPGQLALGGDTVTFPIVIQNYGDDHTYSLSATNYAGWSTHYEYNGRQINQIYVPENDKRTLNLVVETSYTSPINTHSITAKVDGNSLGLSVTITSVNSSVSVSAQVSTVIGSIGGSADYTLFLENVQSQDNGYSLSVTGLPDGWYYKFKESAQSTGELAEVIVPASSTKSLILEITPLLSAEEGDYNFTAVVTTPDGNEITKNLTLRLKGSIGMSAASDTNRYDASPGQAFSIPIYVTNSGKGQALTDVHLEVSAPSGWTVTTSPEQYNSIKAGETQLFTVSVVPPANIVASLYELDINVVSDQQQTTKVYQINVTTSSIIPYVGGVIVLMIVGGLFVMYRRYGRR
jgi:Predicted membrane protein